MRMVGTGVDLQLLELGPAETVLREHAAHGVAHRVCRLLLHEVGEGLLLDAAREPGVAEHLLLLGLAGREDDLLAVDDHHVVARVDVGGVRGLVLATQDGGDLGGEAAELAVIAAATAAGTWMKGWVS